MRAPITTCRLETRHGLGTVVVSATLLPALEQGLRRAAIAEVHEVRAALEVEAAELAAQRRTSEDVDRMRHALAERDAATTAAALVEADLKFHTAVVAAAHNDVLVEVFGCSSERCATPPRTSSRTAPCEPPRRTPREGVAQLLERHPRAMVGTRPGNHGYEELTSDVFHLLTGILEDLHGPEAGSGVPGRDALELMTLLPA